MKAGVLVVSGVEFVLSDDVRAGFAQPYPLDLFPAR